MAADKKLALDKIIAELQKDDEFEEFDQEDWLASDKDGEDQQLWDEDWDNDDLEDDFTKQLKAELQKIGYMSGEATNPSNNANQS